MRLFIHFILLISLHQLAVANVNVLLIGSATDSSAYSALPSTVASATSVSPFDPTDVVAELTNILGGAGQGAVNVVFEDFHGTSSG